MDKRIKELTQLKQVALEYSCEQNGHTYGPWQKEDENNCSRECKKCGFKRTLPLTDEITKEIAKQQKAKELLEYLQNKQPTPENIIFYLWTIKKYLSYIDIDELAKIITKQNKPNVDSLEEYILINSLIKSIHDTHTDIKTTKEEDWEQYNLLWQEVETYMENQTTQTKSSTL